MLSVGAGNDEYSSQLNCQHLGMLLQQFMFLMEVIKTSKCLVSV